MNVLRRALVGLHWFVGTGAIAGGIGALVDPSGAAIGIDVGVLQRGPFTDFLVPGLFLLFVLGAGNLLAGALLFKNNRRPGGAVSLSLFAILVLWIVIQVYVMGLANAVWLHWIYFVLGLAGCLGTTYWVCTAIPPHWRHLFAGQLQHLLLLAVLVSGALYLAEAGLANGSWLGIGDRTWLHLVIAVAIVHQTIVAAVFRLQLVCSLFSRLFGRWDMLVWGVIFLPLLVLRLLTLVGLALASRGTLALPHLVTVPLAILLIISGVYTIYSVFRWFGLGRALGGDHFRERYRRMPLVKKGAFRFSTNAMYSFAFLLLWAVALLTRSHAALAAALFQHAYIWVHWYCTEEPDMRMMSG